MIEVSFRDKIVSLQQDWLQDPYNFDRSYDFWYIMDSISDYHAIKYAKYAIKCTKSINTNSPSDPNEWLAVCRIIDEYENKNNGKVPLTPGQKRKCLFHVIRFWDNIEMNLFC